VVEEASREVEVTGSNHGNRKNARLASGWLASGVSPIKSFFSVYFWFLRADPEKTSVLADDLSARQH
jgi:hypothetical protein